MPKITDQDLHTACSNGDGTYSGVKLAQWLVEAVSGKPLREDEARKLIEEAKTKAAERKSDNQLSALGRAIGKEA